MYSSNDTPATLNLVFDMLPSLLPHCGWRRFGLPMLFAILFLYQAAMSTFLVQELR